MVELIPVQYGSRRYPGGITPIITEVAAHFDKSEVTVKGSYSLHTEYSYGPRRLESPCLRRFHSLRKANKRGIPMLWHSENWAVEFADYLKTITSGLAPPTIIEVHPAFSDYSSINRFLEVYSVFERRIFDHFGDVTVLLENRSGTRYSGGRFVVSTVDDIEELVHGIKTSELNLNVALDIPQMFTTHKIKPPHKAKMLSVLRRLRGVARHIRGIHLWGKRRSQSGRLVAHSGDLNSYFEYDQDFKREFLREIYCVLDDDVSRYFVPEVNSSIEDLHSIVNDLLGVGFAFKDR